MKTFEHSKNKTWACDTLMSYCKALQTREECLSLLGDYIEDTIENFEGYLYTNAWVDRMGRLEVSTGRIMAVCIRELIPDEYEPIEGNSSRVVLYNTLLEFSPDEYKGHQGLRGPWMTEGWVVHPDHKISASATNRWFVSF